MRALWARLGRLFARPHTAPRWVVLDAEASGLDARRDRLIAIAAVALRFEHGRPRIELGDSFEVVLRQPEAAPDRPNILLHGIGVAAQREGAEPRAALGALEAWLGESPLLAFHAAFDETLLQRAMKATLLRRLANPWVDVEWVAAALQPPPGERSLDAWLAHWGIDVPAAPPGRRRRAGHGRAAAEDVAGGAGPAG